MIHNLQLFGATDAGMAQSNNGDAFVAQYIDDESHVLLMAISGAGNNAAIAAETTRATVIDFLDEHRDGSDADRLKAALAAADNKIACQAAGNMSDMRCGCCAAIIDPEAALMTLANIGNCSVFTEAGNILPASERNPDHGLGKNNGKLSLQLFVKEFSLNNSSIIMLCTDGLTDMVDREKIHCILTEPHDDLSHIALELMAEANKSGRYDSIALAIMRFETCAISHEPDEQDFCDSNEDMLADVRMPASSNRLLSPRNIALFLVMMIICFFGGYFAAFVQAGKKYSDVSAELNTCRNAIESNFKEISALKDSLQHQKHISDSLRSFETSHSAYPGTERYCKNDDNGLPKY